MWGLKQNIYKTRRLEATTYCYSFTLSTTSVSSESYTYTDCDGLPQTGMIGGVGGYDANTFCARTIDTFSGAILVTNNGACVAEPPAPAPEDYTYYQAEYNPCVAEACSGTATALWFYNLNPNLIVDKYYFDSMYNRAYHIIDGPFTYAEYTLAGSPPAIQTNASFASNRYNTCTCLPIAPE